MLQQFQWRRRGSYDCHLNDRCVRWDLVQNPGLKIKQGFVSKTCITGNVQCLYVLVMLSIVLRVLGSKIMKSQATLAKLFTLLLSDMFQLKIM